MIACLFDRLPSSLSSCLSDQMDWGEGGLGVIPSITEELNNPDLGSCDPIGKDKEKQQKTATQSI